MFWGAAAAPPQRRARKPRDDRGGEPRGKRHAGERDEGRPRIVVLADAGRHDRQRSGPDERPAPAKRGGIMKRLILLAFAASVLTRPATAKDTRFWNLTSSTVKSLELAPAGASAFGPNQCANDPDGAVGHDRRLPGAEGRGAGRGGVLRPVGRELQRFDGRGGQVPEARVLRRRGLGENARGEREQYEALHGHSPF